MIQAKDAVLGRVYITRGGIIKRKNGDVRVWGFDRVRVIEKKQLYKDPPLIYTIVESTWNSQLELPPNYTLYETDETEIKHNTLGYISPNKNIEEIIELTFQEAVEKGYEQIGGLKMENTTSTPKKISNLYQSVVNELISGGSYTEIAKKLGTTCQNVRTMAIRATKQGYDLVKRDKKYFLTKIN